VESESQAQWNSRGHFFAAGAMQCGASSLSGARSKASEKKRWSWQHVDFDDLDLAD
jgi:hypothetical protein